jgi:hypothetical protein
MIENVRFLCKIVFMPKKKIVFSIPLTALALFYSCGGGGGSGKYTDYHEIKGHVVFSKVKHLRVCILPGGNSTIETGGTTDTSSNNNVFNIPRCAWTDDNGTFAIESPKGLPVLIDVGIPAYITETDNQTGLPKIYTGYLSLGKLKVERNNIAITSMALANKDKDLAYEIGALVHALGGDLKGEASKINLEDRQIFEIDDENGHPINFKNGDSLLDLLKEHKVLTLRFKNGGKDSAVEIDDIAKEVKLCQGDECALVDYKPYKWVIVLLLAADNDLENKASLIEKELKNIKVSADVKLVILIDKKNTDGLFKYESEDISERLNETPEKENEIDTGSADQLLEELEKIFNNYPSRYRALIIYSKGYPYKFVITDDSDSDNLYLSELANLLKDLKDNDNVKIDLIGLDVPKVGSVETLYSLINYTDYIVASEISGNDWPYKRIFETLYSKRDLALKPFSLTRILLNAYKDEYLGDNETKVLFVASPKEVNNLVDSINKFVSSINFNDTNETQVVKSARENATVIALDNHTQRVIDLYSFILNYENATNSTQAKDVLNALSDIEKFINNPQKKTLAGINIFYPLNETEDDIEYYCSPENPCGEYVNTFTETEWDDFIKAYLNATSENATSENATSENATSENATSENATSENATSENATSENATSENTTENSNNSTDTTNENATENSNNSTDTTNENTTENSTNSTDTTNENTTGNSNNSTDTTNENATENSTNSTDTTNSTTT